MDSGMRVVIVPIPMHGHTTPALLLARRLVDMGIQSTFVCPQFRIEQLRESIANQGISFKALSSKDAPQLDVDGHDSGALVEWIVSRYLSGEETTIAEFREIVKSMESGLSRLIVITDVPWTHRIAKEFGVPCVLFHASTALDLAIAFHSKKMFAEGTFPSSRDELVSVPGILDPVPAVEIFSMTTPDLQQFYKELCDSFHQSAGVMSVSFEELEPDACKAIGCNKELNPNAVPFAAIGPLLGRDFVNGAVGTKKEHASAVLQWLDAREPASVVYMSFGSFAQASKEQMEAIAAGVEASGVQFVWVVHHEATLPDLFQERTQGKGLVVRTWAPQVAILSHPAVAAFATHCGWNSVMESIFCGVPMAVLPFYDEQRANARLVVERLRVGRALCDLSTCVGDVDDNLDRERIAKVLQELMNSSGELRSRAAQLRQVAIHAAETAPGKLKAFLVNQLF